MKVRERDLLWNVHGVLFCGTLVQNSRISGGNPLPKYWLYPDLFLISQSVRMLADSPRCAELRIGTAYSARVKARGRQNQGEMANGGCAGLWSGA